MRKEKTVIIKNNNWFEQFSWIGNLFFNFIGKKVKITVETVEGE